MTQLTSPEQATDTAVRERTITWEDPLATAATGATMSGLDYLTAVREGTLPQPPIAKLMGIEIEQGEEGRVVFGVTPGEHHYNPIGLVHGGLAATLLDSAMGCAVHTTLPAGTAYSSLEVKVNFARPITRDTGRILCEGKVVHRGRTVATAEGRVYSEETGK